jgi:HEAT repeat protein
MLRRDGAMAVGDRLRCAVQAQPELAVRLLVPLVGSQNREASLMAAKMLGELGPAASPAVPGLVRMLRSRDEDAREIAAQALGRIGPESGAAVPALVEMLSDEKPQLRRAAASALAHVGPAGSAAAVPLARRLGDASPRVRGASSYAFQELAHHGSDAVPVLLGLMEHRDADVRMRAATALGDIGPLAESAGERLRVAAQDPDEDETVRRRARVALGGLDLRNALAKQRGQAVHLLPLLIERIESEDPERRREGVSWLGYLGPSARQVAPLLIELADDPDSELRSLVVHALARIGATDAASLRVMALGL